MIKNCGYVIADVVSQTDVPGKPQMVRQNEPRANQCVPEDRPIKAKVVVRKPLRGWITGGVIVPLTLTAAGFAWWQSWNHSFEPLSIEREYLGSSNEPAIADPPFTSVINDAGQANSSDGVVAHTGYPGHRTDERKQTASVEPIISTDAKFIAVGLRAGPPLNKAVINGDFEGVRLLLANGSEVNAKSGAGSYHSETPLHSVAYAGHIQIAQLLFDYGADVNAIDQYGYTPLRRTVEQGHLAMTELLINKGADIVTRDSNGESLLHVVARTDHVAIARLLITGGVDINAMDRDGFTPLDYAQGSETSMVETLRQHGAICTIC